MDTINMQTPYFLLDEEDFVKNTTSFQNALKKYFKKSIIGFSVKTNSFPYLLKIAREQGCYAEVVSYTEYELALLCSFPKNRIIYNGPMKSKGTFIDALENGAIVNIETKREIEWLNSLNASKHYNIGIRLNVDITLISPEDAKHDKDDSRFGFSAENEEFEQALKKIKSISNVTLNGLHIHRTSRTRSINFYRNLVKYSIDIISKYQLSLNYIDIGGGYFGIFDNKPTYNDYCATISEVFENQQSKDLLRKTTIIVEPGNALTASVFDYHTSVIDCKKVGNKVFITTDGTRNDIDPLFQKQDYIKEIIHKEKNNGNITKQIVSGCTCLEFDRLFELTNSPQLNIGDKICYKNVGAYTMCLSPLFIRYIPKVYSKTTKELLREEWGATEYVAQCKM